MVPGALGTETRRRCTSGWCPKQRPREPRGRGAAAAASEGRLVQMQPHPPAGFGARGFAASGARFAPVPGRRTRLGASMGHARAPCADAAAERGGARLGGTRGLRPRKGAPPPPLAVRPPGTQVSMATASGREPPRGRSRGIWWAPPLAGRVELPPSSRGSGARSAAPASPRPLAPFPRAVLRVLDSPRVAWPFFPDTPATVSLKASFQHPALRV